MNHKQSFRFFVLLFTVLLTSCSSMEANQAGVADTTDSAIVWIDVRTVEEYANDHINGDANVPIQTFSAASVASELGLDKNSRIGLYCGSGVRAGRALIMLEEAGFTNAFNAGGIDDARKLRNLDSP